MRGLAALQAGGTFLFLPGKGAVAHRIYLAEAGGTLALAGELSGEANVFTPPLLLLPGISYAWRVDTIDSAGGVTAGDMWTFTVGCADVGCASRIVLVTTLPSTATVTTL